MFEKLRAILQKNAPGLAVSEDSPGRYGLEATPGPATLRAWGGQVQQARIPVAWVEIKKAYVSYHVMAAASAKVRNGMSKQLAARMQGKTCFNFTASDDVLFRELDQVTTLGIAAFRRAGFIADAR
ncbi:MAG TPA: hypothetical protein VGU74_02105 [Gemmatimonadales bacterium]|nr:hypothetical protein [Gemmatimonadales bacterium]